eukprot:SAG22_NODE_6707_length_821_cov_1.641274_1_plen_188_part_10
MTTRNLHSLRSAAPPQRRAASKRTAATLLAVHVVLIAEVSDRCYAASSCATTSDFISDSVDDNGLTSLQGIAMMKRLLPGLTRPPTVECDGGSDDPFGAPSQATFGTVSPKLAQCSTDIVDGGADAFAASITTCSNQLTAAVSDANSYASVVVDAQPTSLIVAGEIVAGTDKALPPLVSTRAFRPAPA